MMQSLVGCFLGGALKSFLPSQADRGQHPRLMAIRASYLVTLSSPACVDVWCAGSATHSTLYGFISNDSHVCCTTEVYNESKYAYL